MEENGVERAALGRRAFLLASGAVVAALGAARTLAQPWASPADMAQWDAAPTIPLWPNGAPSGGFRRKPAAEAAPPSFLLNVEQPYLRVFRPQTPNGRSLLSIPGGGYTIVSVVNEGIDVANDMTARGYTVFVLVYRLPGEGWAQREDVPLQDAQRAMRIVRARSGDYGCDPEQIYAVGFSAGGHLAASLATGFAEPLYEPRDAADSLSARPRAVGLIYPVISHTAGVGHADSTLRLLGESPSAASVARRSPALQVSETTPPAFLLHAIDDLAVPLENSLLMLSALRSAGRPAEAHFFERGSHGFGTGQPGQPNAEWPRLFANWMESHAV